MGIKLDIYEIGGEVVLRYMSEFSESVVLEVALHNLKNFLDEKLYDGESDYYIYSTGLDVRVDLGNGDAEDLKGLLEDLKDMRKVMEVEVGKYLDVQQKYLSRTGKDWYSLVEWV